MRDPHECVAHPARVVVERYPRHLLMMLHDNADDPADALYAVVRAARGASPDCGRGLRQGD